MAKDQAGKAPSTEDAEIEKMLAEEAAKADADKAANEAKVKALASVAEPAPAPVTVVASPSAGRARVRCLKTEPTVVRGHERYNLVAGKEIEMDASHARELEAQGWVLRFQLTSKGKRHVRDSLG